MHLARAVFACFVLVPALGAGAKPAPPPASPREPAPFCTGEYADFLTGMSRDTRVFEASADAGYTYCIRTTATYEHVYYGKGGKLRRRYVRHVRHGTGFAYKAVGGEWFVATNEHVAEHPLVTEADDVDGVPAGSRKVRETIRIVSSEGDDDDASQVPLTKVLADEALDLAVLKTRHPLKVMPYRIGRSSALRVGNAVQVRGYPLGAFAASNTGRVISTGQPDHERGWSHEDFAIDAPLNAGNSGSAVLAVSCRTGELELVGVYHAGYKDAQALNVVVAVDQLRDVLESRTPRSAPAADPVDRKALVALLRGAPAPFLMPFGDRAIRVDVEGDAVRFALLDADFPLTSRAQAALVDRDADLARPSALVLPPRFGDQEIPWAALEPTLRDPGQRFYAALWRQLAAVLAFRDGEGRGRTGPEARAALAASASRIRAHRAEQKDILQSIDFEEDLAWPPSPAAPSSPLPGRAPDPASDDD
ncbi:MAG TPA: serine protease [Anaeromyxobacteraceae bacterium]